MDERFYMKDHMEFLIGELKKSYYNKMYDEFDIIKKQIWQLKEVMNSIDRVISERQKLKKLED